MQKPGSAFVHEDGREMATPPLLGSAARFRSVNIEPDDTRGGMTPVGRMG